MIALADTAATEALGRRIAAALQAVDAGLGIALEGELGAGKTTLVRAVLKALGVAGPVVSPSYTLVEPYALAARTVYHLDLYRLADPEELEFLGVREIDRARDWLFVEWAAHGTGFLPDMDVAVLLEYAGSARCAQIRPRTTVGRTFCARLENVT